MNRNYRGVFVLLTVLVSVASMPYAFSQEKEEAEDIMARDRYIVERRAGGPGRTVPQDGYTNAVREHLELLAAPREPERGSGWVSVNPSGMFYSRTSANYIAGRTNSIAFHPSNANIIYSAAAQGGVWKTTDGGVNWSVLTDNLTSLASGALAIDPLNPNTLYYGTGELNYSLDSYYGDGIFKTTDGGSTWTKVATTTVGSRFSQLVVDPTNSTIVYAAGSAGVYKSTNGGTSWSSTSSGTSANCLIIDPSNSQVLYTAVGGTGTNTIMKTTNGGTTWTALTSGLPASNRGRTQLAIAASSTNTLYASIAHSSSGALLGLYRTTNGGSSWTAQNTGTNYLGGQGWYDNAVTVHPTNSSLVIVGGIDIYTSTNSGVTLTKRTDWATTSASTMSHADIHFLGYRGTILYCGSDGGVYRSTNNGVTWTDLNRTISTLQYQSADYDHSNPLKLYGGTQDNDMETSTDGGVTWIQRTTGDGGYTAVNPVTTTIVYGAYVNGSIKRSMNSGVNYTEISPNGSTGGLFYNPYLLAPSDPNTIVYGQADVWKTTSATTASTTSGWVQIATTGTVGGSVASIGISHTNSNKIYVGTSNGRILRTTNNGGVWATTTGLPYVTDLVVDQTDDNICYASFSGFDATRHVYKTTNGGTTWLNLTGNLPNIPVNSIVVIQTSPRTLFAGTDLGVYRSNDDGTTWSPFNTNFPTVAVFDLKYHDGPMILLAATHGRGCFTYDLSTSLPIQLASFTALAIGQNSVRLDWTTISETNNYGFEVERKVSASAEYQMVPQSFIPGHGTTTIPQSYTFTDAAVPEGEVWYRLKQIDLDGTIHYTDGIAVTTATDVNDRTFPSRYALHENYPNPFNPSTTIEFSLPERSHVTVRIYDIMGREMETLVDDMRGIGTHRLSWNAAGRASGVYFYRMETAGFTETKRMILMR